MRLPFRIKMKLGKVLRRTWPWLAKWNGSDLRNLAVGAMVEIGGEFGFEFDPS